MHAGGVDGVNGINAGDDAGDDRAGQLVDEGAEAGVFLRRPAHGCERPDGAVAMIDAFDVQHREVMFEAVIAEVVAEWSFGLAASRVDRALDDEIGFGGHGQSAVGGDECDPAAAQGTGEGELGKALGQGHDGGDRQGRGATDADVDAQRLAARDGGGMVHADAAVNLVVEPGFAIRHVLIAGELHAVHAQVRLSRAGPVGVFGINQRKRHKGPAVIGPALDLRELVECGLVGEDRSISSAAGQQPPEWCGQTAVAPGILGEAAGLDLELDK